MPPRTLPRALLLLAAVFSLTISAQADPPTVLFRLTDDATFQEGCFGMCLCPVLIAGLQGTFTLTPTGTSSDGFTEFAVEDVRWTVFDLGQRITGSGTYRVRTGPDGLQQLVLDLSTDGGPVERYDSGLVPRTARFPAIDVLASLNDMTCYDRVFEVRAVPAGPVTFRFEGRVESVFDGLGALGGKVAAGDVFRGVFTFDPATPNTAPPIDEGETGLYHHDRPPAGVRLRVDRLIFGTVWATPDFDVIVNNDFGFAGADEFGFVSRVNRAHGLTSTAPVDRLEIDWLASTITEEPLDSADLPLLPPDLDLLGGGLLTVEGECTLCLGPAAFFRIEGTLTSLTRPARLWLDGDQLSWSGPAGSHDVLRGDLADLRAGGGALESPAVECLANDDPGATLADTTVPAPGQSFWFAVRPVTGGADTYDSFGLAQQGIRDDGVETGPPACP